MDSEFSSPMNNRKKKEASVQLSSPMPLVSRMETSRFCDLCFDRLQPSDCELDQHKGLEFGKYVAREALLEEEYWAASWLRAENQWENRSYPRNFTLPSTLLALLFSNNQRLLFFAAYIYTPYSLVQLLSPPETHLLHQTKVILKVELYDDKIKKKAMKAVSGLSGVESVSMDMKDQKMTLIGDIDPVRVVGKLRKLCHAEILSVGLAKEEKKEEPKKEDKKAEEKKKNPNEQKAELVKTYEAYYNQTRQPYITELWKRILIYNKIGYEN